MSEDRTRHDVLARIADNPQLARAVPDLQPQVLHAVIAHYGLQDCGELLALVTPAQLSAVFDLDLWKPARAGADEQFDASRFLEWLEVLVDTDAGMAADRLAAIDTQLVVAGLSPHVTVWDPGVFEPTNEDERTGADAVLNAGRERGVHAEIGGYLVVTRRADAWDAVVQALTAFDERHPDAFHKVMRGCRRLSNSGREFDGLDDLLLETQQVRFDVSVSREERRDRLGYLPPEQARAFLDAARLLSFTEPLPQENAVFAAYRRSQMSNGAETPAAATHGEAGGQEPAADTGAVGSVIEILRGAGVLADAPRALLPGTHEDNQTPINTALQQYLEHDGVSAHGEPVGRNQELAFLANALMSGCSVQSRPFRRHEAMDAVTATCNLGLECWPPEWPPPLEHNLVTVFQVGWTVLYRDVSMVAADQLLAALDHVQTCDQDIQFGLRVLRRELRKERQAGTPWRACERLEVLSPLDLPTWAALTSLFDECPVMLSNVWRASSRPQYTVNPADFQFVAEPRHVTAVRDFLQSLATLLTAP